MNEALCRDLVMYAKTGKHLQLNNCLDFFEGDINTCFEEVPLLIHSAARGRSMAIQVLLERRASIDWSGRDGCTALMYASSQGHLEAVKVLIAGGADPRLKDYQGLTALEHARANKHPEVFNYLENLTPQRTVGINDEKLRAEFGQLGEVAAVFARDAIAAGAPAEWSSIPDNSVNLPLWYVTLLTHVPLANIQAWLSPPNWPQTESCCFGSFAWANEFESNARWLLDEFNTHHLVPFATGNDGNYWMISRDEEPNGPVSLWSLSDMAPVPCYLSFHEFLASAKHRLHTH